MEVSDLRRCYDPVKNCIRCFYDSGSSGDVWDENWSGEDIENFDQRNNRWFVEMVERELPKGSKLIEGGCGVGDKVYSLGKAGFDVLGVDFAQQTLARSKGRHPELKLELGDVRQLPVDDASIDGFLSLGVIEHYDDGYDDQIAEMRRVLRKDGVLFLTFPFMSPLKKLKARLGGFEPYDPARLPPEPFYQYELSPTEVEEALKRHGFRVSRREAYAEELGLKTDCPALYSVAPWRWLRDYRGRNVPIRGLRWAVNRLVLHPLRGLFGYSVLIVARKTA